MKVEVNSNHKFKFPEQHTSAVDKYVMDDKLYIPYLLWVLSNISIVFFGSVLVAYIEVSYNVIITY